MSIRWMRCMLKNCSSSKTVHFRLHLYSSGREVAYNIKWSGNLLAIAQRSLYGKKTQTHTSKREIESERARAKIAFNAIGYFLLDLRTHIERKRERRDAEADIKHRIKSHFEMSLSRLQMIGFGCFCMDVSLLYGRFVIWHHISLHHFSFVFGF